MKATKFKNLNHFRLILRNINYYIETANPRVGIHLDNTKVLMLYPGYLRDIEKIMTAEIDRINQKPGLSNFVLKEDARQFATDLLMYLMLKFNEEISHADFLETITAIEYEKI
jgi:hypothetical protein